MKSKKILTTVLAFAMVATLALGCSSKETDKSNEGEDQKKSVKLVFWGGVPADAGPQNVVDTWNKANPDVQVEYNRFVNDDEGNLKLDTALITNQAVDVYFSYNVPRLQKRVDAGTALNLKDFKDYDIEDKMGPSALDWKIGEDYYAIPTTKNVYMIWLNDNLLKEHNLAVPTAWTWSEMQEYANKLKTDKRYGLVQFLESYADPMDSILSQFGETKADGTSNLDHPGIATWLTTLNEMMGTGATAPLGEQLTSKMPVETMFLKGEAAMLNAGPYIFRSSNNLTENPREFKIAFAPVPRITEDPAEHKQRNGLGDGLTINPKSKHVDEAWAFSRWYADEGVMLMAAGGRVPSSKDVDREAAVKLMIEGVEDLYDVDSLQNVLFEQENTFTRKTPQQVLDLRREEYEKFFIGSQQLEQTINNMVKRHNDYLKQ
ncbi:ABC transporter substrate-binding protein [Paenibacillus mendelii]|uniref:ABC transporter substrate-binding protein n=1 Tax=Paenibacillus mendelii TaxID=206163 RepID=A0ABV6JHY0_9BACL|nr:extracellular solute-binding protein [Paenibacillus mendelii]MCQ6563377.1 extracellular solute-binding protein [Paenibacillus mendelii]